MSRLLLILGAVAVVAALVWRPPSPVPPVALASASSAPSWKHGRRVAALGTSSAVVVYVAGAVVHPGLYHLRAGARDDDAVRSAGGFRGDADTGAVNLAAHVADGDEVYVSALGAPTPRPVRSRGARQATKKIANAVVDVNTADKEQLATVPGIGATLAARIVDVRERDGAFANFDELLDVAGITASRLARAEPYLRI